MRKLAREFLFSAPSFPPILDRPPAHKLLLLNEELSQSGITELEQLPFFSEQLRGEEEEVRLDTGEITLTYAHVNAIEAMRRLLPDGVDPLHSFETVGHIAHVNLRDEQLPFAEVLAQVILDKNPRLRTVVNKTATIATQFRTFPLQVIAGDNDMIATVSESGCQFRFDFSQVYWNSRLQYEHGRLIKEHMQPGDSLFDMFCGVGPFALPATRANITVHANDLNPASYRFLCDNVLLNKTTLAGAYNMDARQFVRRMALMNLIPHQRPSLFVRGEEEQQLVARWQTAQVEQSAAVGDFKRVQQAEAARLKKKETLKRKEAKNSSQSPSLTSPSKRKNVNGSQLIGKSGQTDVSEQRSPRAHFVMNLPASAVEFVDVFRGIFERPAKNSSSISNASNSDEDHFQLPWIHCYGFTKKNENPEKELIDEIESRLGCSLIADRFSSHNVRNVAPSKFMFCISFQLPAAAAFANLPEEREAKKIKR